MQVSKAGKIVAVAGLVALAVALMIYSTIRLPQVSCEVCIEFQGQSKCRSASGATREDAIRTATDNACAYISSGMAAGIQCGNTPPSRTTCNP